MRRLLFVLWLGAVACTPAPLPKSQFVDGAAALDFVCVDEPTGDIVGPIDGCGCHLWDPARQTFSTLGRIQCECVSADGVRVERVKTGPCGTSDCILVDEFGDWVVAEDTDVDAVACEAQGRGRVAAVVAQPLNRSMSLVMIPQRGQGTRVVDQSLSIPGQTGHFVDDVILDVFAHPAGRTYFSVNSMTGGISVFENARSVGPSRTVQLDIGPIYFAELGGLLTTAAIPSLFLVGETLDRVYEYRIDAFDLAASDEELSPVGCYGLSADSGCVQYIETSGDASIASIGLDPSGRYVLVGLHGQQTLLGFDRFSERNSTTLQWHTDISAICADRYVNYESVNGCQLRSQCFDGVDNDLDGMIDGEDLDCSDADSLFEGDPSDCGDGMDNDGDGLVDRNDPGCASILDESEVDSETGVVCMNQVDDDGDGLTDALDPGCWDEELGSSFVQDAAPSCSDGLDNDGDGSTDFSEGDAACAFAAERTEGGVQLAPSINAISTVVAPRFGPLTWQLVVRDESGQLRTALMRELEMLTQAKPKIQSAKLLAARGQSFRGETIIMTDDGELALAGFVQRSPIRVNDNLAFAAVPSVAEEEPTVWEKIKTGYGAWYEGVYIVEGGVAYSSELLRSISCVPPSCDDQAQCPAGGECSSGLCVASSCSAGECPDGSACRNGFCIAACENSTDCGTGLTCSGGRCSSSCVSVVDGQVIWQGPDIPSEVDALSPFDVVDSGTDDPALYFEDAADIEYVTSGDRSTAFTVTHQLTGSPTLSEGGRTGRIDPNTTAYFCDLDQLQEDLTACTPAGFTLTYGEQTPQSSTERAQTYPSRIRAYDEVVLSADYFGDTTIGADFYQIRFEGTIPNSSSKHGVHGGMSDGGWHLVDPRADFCALGVQSGDVVKVERFRAASADVEDCRPWLSPSLQGSPDQRLEALRYKILKVNERSLELIKDDREDYFQVARTASQQPPKPAEPVDVPPVDCIADGFTYEIRVADEEWLVTSGTRGYAHNVRSEGGACIRDSRGPTPGRAVVGSIYEDDRVKFRLGYPALTEDCGEQACQPYSIDTALSFGVRKGTTAKGGSVSVITASAMEWLPFDDGLYIVDPTAATLIHQEGLSSERPSYYESSRLK